MVPDARRHDTALARHASHLPQARDGVGHEVHDELSKGRVECAVVEGQLLGCGPLDVDPGAALAAATNGSEGSTADTASAPSRVTSSVVSAPGPEPTSSTR